MKTIQNSPLTALKQPQPGFRFPLARNIRHLIHSDFISILDSIPSQTLMSETQTQIPIPIPRTPSYISFRGYGICQDMKREGRVGFRALPNSWFDPRSLGVVFLGR